MSLKLNGWVKDGLTVVSGKLSDSNTQADQLIFNLWYCVYSCLAVRQQLGNFGGATVEMQGIDQWRHSLI